MPDGAPSPVRLRRAPEIGERGYKRLARDAYFTKELWVTEAGLSKLTLRGKVWECACGLGHMTRVLEAAGYDVVSTDISRRRYDGLFARLDFTRTTELPVDGIGTIFTNPPNSLADAFVHHAVQLMKPVRGMVVMLLDHSYVAAGPTRDFLFEPPMPFAGWIVVTRRPKWIDDPKRLKPGEKKRTGPRRNYAFGVWDWRHEGPATIARVR